jgi:SOS response regulatory protein OraA/RecX
MSLAVLANHMASKGRNGDSMLVHMAPSEVAGLQALGLSHGITMTINPHTGLPEAFSFKKLLKSALPMIAGFALGPAGFGIVSSALGAGALVGGATALATGSLQKGIMAGLGAYGGASLGTALSSTGASAMNQAAVDATLAANPGLTAGEIAREMGTAGFTAPQIAASANPATAGIFDKFGAGIKALGTQAGRTEFMKQVGGGSGLLKAGYAAAAPILADQAVPTATPMPGGQYQGTIRPYKFDPFTKQWTAQPTYPAMPVNTAPAPAPAPQEEQPPGGMAGGGIVALATGGSAKPDLRTLVESQGVKIDDRFYDVNNPDYERNQQLLRRASDVLYGNIGANTDARDWTAIMAAGNPLAAAATATTAMYSDPKYKALNAQDLLSRGYLPEQADYTYKQMQDRVGATYDPNWTKGTAFEGKVNTPTYLEQLRKVEGDPEKLAAFNKQSWQQWGGDPRSMDAAKRPTETSLASSLRFGLPALMAPAGFGGYTPDAQRQYYNELLRKGYSDTQIRAMIPTMPRFAAGGSVGYAPGGPVLPSDVGTYTPEQKADLYNKFLSQGFNDAAIRQAAGQQTDADWQTLQQLAAQRGAPAVSGAERTVLTDPNWKSISGQTGIEGLNANIQNFVQQNPNVSYGQVQAAANQYGVDAADIRRALEAGGGSGGLQNVLTQADWRSRTGLTGLEGMNNNIQMWFAENPNATEAQIRQAMQGVNINDADIMRAMGKSVTDLAYKPPAPKPPVTGADTVTGGGADTVTGRGVDTVTGTTGMDTVYGGNDVLDRITLAELGTPGKVTQENLTMNQVRDIYEQGGGATEMPTVTRLGPNERVMTQNAVVNDLQAYLANNPNATSTEITAWGRANGVPDYQLRAAVNERRFNMMTGGSKSAYDYLMGRGAYPTTPFVPGGGPIMRPYSEVVGGESAMRRYVPTTPTRQTAQSAGTGTTGATNQAALDRLRSTFDRSIFSQSPEAKAAYYNSLLTAGYDDATIRAAINAPLDDNWLALQAIAARLRAGTTGGGGVSSARVTSGGASMGGGSSGAGVTGAGSSGTSTTGSGTPITDFLFGTQDASKVPVEDRTITRLQDRQPEVSEYDPNAYNYDVGSGYYHDSDTEDRDEDDEDTESKRAGGITTLAGAARGGQFNLGGYSDGGRLLRGPGDGVSDSIPATIGNRQPARLADGEFVIPARIVSEIGNGSTEAGARKLYAMMDRVQRARAKTTGKGKVAKNTRADKYLPA